MTTEEKAKAYDEALKKAKKYHEEYWQVDAKDITETLFPQLCESEDERIRKELVEKITNLACGCFISQEQKQRFIHYLEKQKEQKPAEKQDYSGLNDLERAILRGFLAAGIENVPVTIIKETAQDCLAHMPAEWSEEDEKQLDDIISIIRGAYEHGITISETRHRNAYFWLNNLRPSWKPSEEQMEALRYVAYEHGNSSLSPYSIANKTLASLYEQLKKL